MHLGVTGRECQLRQAEERAQIRLGSAELAVYQHSALGVQGQPTESLIMGEKLSEHRGLLLFPD